VDLRYFLCHAVVRDETRGETEFTRTKRGTSMHQRRESRPWRNEAAARFRGLGGARFWADVLPRSVP
jgi:hypothetical protein